MSVFTCNTEHDREIVILHRNFDNVTIRKPRDEIDVKSTSFTSDPENDVVSINGQLNEIRKNDHHKYKEHKDQRNVNENEYTPIDKHK